MKTERVRHCGLLLNVKEGSTFLFFLVRKKNYTKLCKVSFQVYSLKTHSYPTELSFKHKL